MSFRTFRKKCLPYWDQDGLFKGNANTYPSTNNGLFLTGIYYVLLKFTGSDDVVDAKSFTDRITRHMVPGYQGLWHERKGHPGRISHDDIMLICAAGYFWNWEIPQKIVHYGRKHSWTYDNTNPGKPSPKVWHGRFPGVIQHYKVSAGEKLSAIDRFLWCMGIWVTIWWTNGTSGSQKDLFAVITMVESPKNHSWSVKKTIRAFHQNVIKHWGSVPDMLAVYHGASHPFVEASKSLEIALRKF